MADNTYRTSRRDPAASGQLSDDPLAELARLIGQTPPANATPPQHHEAPPLDAQEVDQQWPAEQRHAEQYPEQYDQQTRYGDQQGQYGEGQYGDSEYDDRQYSDSRDAPRVADSYPPYRAAPPSYNAEYEQPEQAQAQAYDTRGYAEHPRYDDEHDSIQDLPAFLPRLREETAHGRAQVRAQGYAQNYGEETYSQSGQGRYEQDDPGQAYDQAYGQDDGQQVYEQRYAQEDEADDQAYALEDYEDQDEVPAPKRRGFAIAAAVLGLLVLGTAGVFGYRSMFGGSMLPSLPPIIKADGTPNKIIPAGTGSNASGQASAGSGGNKLVSREEKPVEVPSPANTPRVVSTIPVFPDPNAGLQSSAMPGNPNMAQQTIGGAVANGIMGAGAPGGPLPGTMPPGPTTAAPVYGAAPTAAPPASGQQAPATPGQAPVAGTANSKKIHTVAIHTGPQDSSDSAAAAAPAPAQGAPAAAPPRSQAARPSATKPAPASQGGPLSIVPSQQGGGDTTPHTRTAVARPAAEPAAPSGSGVFVQVLSQRSESEAQSAYRAMQARFPSQLGGHAATVRQVNLEKGTFYRALVGPFASTEQAAQMCASLKAAGGSCLVQRN